MEFDVFADQIHSKVVLPVCTLNLKSEHFILSKTTIIVSFNRSIEVTALLSEIQNASYL